MTIQKLRPKSKSKTYRFRLLIYPRFQLGLVFANMGLMGLALGFVAVQFFRCLGNIKAMGIQAKIPPEHAYYRFLEWQAGQFQSYMILAFGLAFVSSLIVTLLLSNRMAGPIVRLRGYFKKIKNHGAVDHEIKFRKGDFFSDLPGLINDALRKVTDRDKAA